MKEILKRLKEKPGVSAIERVFGLQPFGILSKWKKDVSKIPPASKTLLRMIDTFPWLLRVAGNKYEEADEILIDEAIIKPETTQQLAVEGWSVKFKDLFVNLFNQLGARDADQYFTQAKEPAQGAQAVTSPGQNPGSPGNANPATPGLPAQPAQPTRL